MTSLELVAGDLSPLEEQALRRVFTRGERAWRRLAGSGGSGAIRLELAAEALFPTTDAPLWGEPARVSANGDEIRLDHAVFQAIVEPQRSRLRLYRDTSEAFPLEIALRTTLCALMPAAGGLPLHAAGVVAGAGLVFFGPSGAGKSTLAACSPFDVVSDELVAVAGEPWSLVESGFFGALEPASDDRRREDVPLVALFELEKLPDFQLTRLSPRTAARRMLGSLLVPPAPGPWRAALATLARLTEQVPVYRLGWKREEPPWNRLSEALPELEIPSALSVEANVV